MQFLLKLILRVNAQFITKFDQRKRLYKYEIQKIASDADRSFLYAYFIGFGSRL